ncbi:hypothetical protein [Microbulbifer hydrolyticus]|uniref:Secreted protein n=1 Tax=Microbulbifer hydrolyticus TaxID=48074 RepID=A0A6P1TDQ3_9GAMM|nr:hypothetical protein [Microbulbifer hydrolyticus]MBB5211998.1 hypothetical protein [Microbulbifer hydrolyticus]QHQ39680.1 hypothetical protein GTQ55_12245 [Microbulbifer hydrolyticus]
MKKAKQIIILAALLLPTVVIAGEWTPPVDIKVSYVHLNHGGYGFYEISDTSRNPDNCNTSWYVVSKQNNPIFNEIYSLMLASHMSGKQVRLFIQGCSPHGHPEIMHVKTVK